ncbi:MAG: hypothetical protein O7F73_03465 [Gammaproteobacteria bacterium]|nr:hypothetical protein [Gammaproteobacteria bacterium]
MSTGAVAADKSLAEMKLLDPQTLKCPYHYDQALRAQAPVHQDPDTGVYIVSTYELVRAAHKAKDVFSNEFTLALGSTTNYDPQVLEAMRPGSPSLPMAWSTKSKARASATSLKNSPAPCPCQSSCMFSECRWKSLIEPSSGPWTTWPCCRRLPIRKN